MNITEQTSVKTWVKALKVNEVPENDGVVVLIDNRQIAIFNFADKGSWYATQNLCPHKNEMALSRGLLGDAGGEPKVACPFHKKTFSLESGECLNDHVCSIAVFPVKVESGDVYVKI